MKSFRLFSSILGIMAFCFLSNAQDQKNIAEKLGYARDAKLLIIHADDIGLAQSVNTATIKAFENGGISSGSIMVPCPWFQDFAEHYSTNPTLDVGIHITLNAEWDYYKWDGVMPSSEISSLLDSNGYFYPSVEELAQHVNPIEAEKEIRAQIERAIEFGIRPSHIDTHMGSVGASPELIQIYLKLGKEYGLPLLIPRFWIASLPEEMRTMVEENNVILDGFYMLNEEQPGVSWEEAYGRMIKGVKPGLTQMIVHLAIDNEEMRAISKNHSAFGSAWRQKDLDLLTSKNFQDMLKENNIQLVSWKEIKAVM